MTGKLRIATRQSPLALWQAEHVAAKLRAAHPGMATELVPMRTRGDKILHRSLAKVGGKGLFIKELELALLDQRADIAVHSMKDMPAMLTEGLTIAAVLERANPYDAFVSMHFDNFDALPEGARLGTSSLRRSSQLLSRRPDLQIIPLRGNVQTRLGKLDMGECDAIILAAAGLVRLGLEHRITAELSSDQCLPAIGQGIIGIECRENDASVIDQLHAIHHDDSWQAIAAERSLGAELGGNCQSPIAGFAYPDGDQWTLDARVLTPDGRQIVEGQMSFARPGGRDAGQELAKRLLDDGAREILAEIAASS